MSVLPQQWLKNDFSSFIAKTFSTIDPSTPFIPNWHIELIVEYLEAARCSEVTRLIINMPPRSLKSICVSVAWPAWLLGHDPRARILAASYASSLSIKHSLDCRLVIGSPWYQKLFPDVHFASDQNQKHKFMTTEQGFRLSTSIGGSSTGEGGNFLIIDDPLNPAQAMNQVWRDYTNRWFDHTFASRLNDKRKGVIVLVMQRLHGQDLTGHLLAKGGWKNLCLSGVAKSEEFFDFGKIHKCREHGELLHPARENHEIVARAKIELGSSAFSAQYQQQPIEDENAFICRRWFPRYKTIPPVFVRIVQSWDTAIKSGPQNDASVCLTFGEENGHSYLLDVKSFRYEYPDLKKIFYSLAGQWDPAVVLLEGKASGQQLIQDVRKESALPVIAIQPKNDKITRFVAVSPMMEAGRMVLPVQTGWLADFEAELFAFPHSPHDDQVDALTQYLGWIRDAAWDRLRIRVI